MANPNLQPQPQTPDPIELQLLALHELATNHQLLQLQLLKLSGAMIALSVEEALDEAA